MLNAMPIQKQPSENIELFKFVLESAYLDNVAL